MQSDLNDVFVDVASECYRRALSLREGSEESAAAEHAITLLLSGDREASSKERDVLLHDVLRNARHSVRRSRARLLRAVDHLGQLAERGVATGGVRGFAVVETPEDALLAHDLLAHLHEEATRSGAHGLDVLAGLLNGSSTREIASVAGVSSSTVNRTIKALRDTIVTLGYREAC